MLSFLSLSMQLISPTANDDEVPSPVLAGKSAS